MTDNQYQGSLSPSETRESIRTELESTRRAFHRLLDQLSEDDLQAQSLNPDWTVGEVLYHMSLAPRNLPNDLVLIRRLNRIPKISAGPFNWLNKRITKYGARNATKEYLAQQYDQAHEKTIHALNSIQDDEWQLGVDYPDWDPMLSGYVTIERLFHYISLHFESHSRDIRLVIDKKMSTHEDGLRRSGRRDEYVYLADRPEMIPLLAGWFFNEWGSNDPQRSLETIEGKLRGRLHRDRIPLALVLLRDDSPIASASLKIREMETHPQYLHWLGSVYVLPKVRHQGIGSQLVQATAAEAMRLGVKELYLYTRHWERFYARLGWKPIERPVYRGRPSVIMLRNLLEVNKK